MIGCGVSPEQICQMNENELIEIIGRGVGKRYRLK